MAIAKKQIDFKPDLVGVRLVKRGFNSRPYWAVSLSQRKPGGGYQHVTVVVIDANTAEVTEVRGQ